MLRPRGLIFVLTLLILCSAPVASAAPVRQDAKSTAMALKAKKLIAKLKADEPWDSPIFAQLVALGEDAAWELAYEGGRGDTEKSVALGLALAAFGARAKPVYIAMLEKGSPEQMDLAASSMALQFNNEVPESARAYMRDPEIISGLRKALQDSTASAYAAEVLSQLHDVESYEAIKSLFTASDRTNIWRLFECLCRFGDATHRDEVMALLPKMIDFLITPDQTYEVDDFLVNRAFMALLALPSGGADELRPYLSDPRELVRTQACATAFFMPPLLKEVGELILDPSPKVRYEALRSYGKLAKGQALPVLVELLTSKDLQTRVAAIGGLGYTEDARILPALLKLSTDPNKEIREAVGEALYARPEPESIKALMKLLKDPNESVRLAAKFSLDFIRDARKKKKVT